MASAIATPNTSFCLSSLSPSSTTRKHLVWSISNSAISSAQVPNFEFSKWVPQLGLGQFSEWNGLKNLGISSTQLIIKMEKKGRYKGKGVYASLFGVGAPEALVIGVVALLVFGPKGLAEVARNLGKTLRAFQPTIRELQDVSREFKSTLEREIGLEDIQASNQNTDSSSSSRTSSRPSSSPNSSFEASPKEIDPNGSSSPSKAYSTEDYLTITEEQLKAASAAQQERESTFTGESQSEIRTKSQDSSDQAASAIPSPGAGKTENEG